MKASKNAEKRETRPITKVPATETRTLEELQSWFREELERKDSEIQRLKKENHVLFMTALKVKQSQTKP